MTINQGIVGKHYIIERINLSKYLKHRLYVLGILEGTSILILNKKRQGALVIKVRGTRFAMGKEITSFIDVKEASIWHMN